MIPKLVKEYGEAAQLDICIEECAELIHACSKYKRAGGDGYKTSTNKKFTRIDLTEAVAHAINAIRGVMLIAEIEEMDVRLKTYESDMQALGKTNLPTDKNKEWLYDNECLTELLPGEEE